MSNLSKAERDKLPSADFADESNRLFPILDADDVEKAARLVGKAADPVAVKRRIKQLAAKKNLAIPASWKDSANMSDELFNLALFSDEGKEEQGDYVLRKCPVVFRADDYFFPPLTGETERRKFTMTPEDLLFACSEAPEWLDVDDNHAETHHPDGTPIRPSIFKGELGKMKLNPSADFKETGADYLCPKWLDKKYEGKPIPVSATFDWQTKRFKNIALCFKPRVADARALPNAAAIFAELPSEDDVNFAWEAEQARKAVNPTPAVKPAETSAVVPVAPAAATFAAAPMTAHGLAGHQAIHDIAARSGAICSATKTAGMSAEFTTQAEHDGYQIAHDAAVKSGAQCRMIPAGTDHVGPMVASYAAEFAAASMTPEVKALKDHIAALEADREKERKARAEATFAAELSSGKDRGEAAFTDMFRRGAAVPAEKAGLVGEYTQAVLDDLIDRQRGKSPEVQFSVDGGAFQTGSREDAVKARWKARPESLLLKELKDGDAGFTVLADAGDPSGVKAQNDAGDDLAGRCMTAKK